MKIKDLVNFEGKYTLVNDDAQKILQFLPSNSIDSMVIDGPYGIGYLNKQWDIFSHNSSSYIRKKECSNASREVLGYQEWCHEWAHKALKVIKPGGHILAFSSRNRHHRLVSALEDAGWEIRDLLAWVYGNGYPKSSISKEGFGAFTRPAIEPICLARKPLSEKTLFENYSKWGTGLLNLGACKIKGEGKGKYPTNIMLDKPSGELLDSQSSSLPSRYFYCPKPSKKEKEAGLEDMPVVRRDVDDQDSDNVMSKKIPQPSKNPHTTIKPIELMRYLCRLVTPPGGLTIDFFMGAGSTGIAAILEGFRFIGIEKDKKYFKVAKKRIQHFDDKNAA